MQYTLRNIPAFLDRMLRRRARQERASLNDIAIQALARGMGIGEERTRKRDLAALAGLWAHDAEFDAALIEQDSVDEQAWR
jgi:hypothetical protein